MEYHPCFKVFMEINYHYSRLAVLGNEGLKVLEVMRREGMPMDVHDPLFEVAVRAAGLENKSVKDSVVKETKRCKWWNRGYCREKEGCSYAHHKGDCQDHLKGAFTIKGCNVLRHRKRCKYLNTEQGCHRGESQG